MASLHQLIDDPAVARAGHELALNFGALVRRQYAVNVSLNPDFKVVVCHG
jgi:hypothetical protein